MSAAGIILILRFFGASGESNYVTRRTEEPKRSLL
jgi:hypothetical protein